MSADPDHTDDELLADIRRQIPRRFRVVSPVNDGDHADRPVLSSHGHDVALRRTAR